MNIRESKSGSKSKRRFEIHESDTPNRDWRQFVLFRGGRSSARARLRNAPEIRGRRSAPELESARRPPARRDYCFALTPRPHRDTAGFNAATTTGAGIHDRADG